MVHLTLVVLGGLTLSELLLALIAAYRALASFLMVSLSTLRTHILALVVSLLQNDTVVVKHLFWFLKAIGVACHVGSLVCALRTSHVLAHHMLTRHGHALSLVRRYYSRLADAFLGLRLLKVRDVLFLAIWTFFNHFADSFSVFGVLILLILKVAGLRVRLVALAPTFWRVKLVVL